MLGLYVSDHPLVGAEAALRRHTDCTILDLREEGSGRDLAVREPTGAAAIPPGLRCRAGTEAATASAGSAASSPGCPAGTRGGAS